MKLNRELNNVQFWKYICLYEMIKFSDENAIAQLSLTKISCAGFNLFFLYMCIVC